MTILGLILLCVLVGVALWIVNTYVPMQAGVKNVMNIAVVVVLVLYIVSAFGRLGPLNAPIRPVR